MNDFFRIESISQIHQLLGLEKPRHPLITLIEASDLKGAPLPEFGGKVRNELYLVSLKNGTECKFIYGRESYDFQEGTIIFLAPGQVVAPSDEAPAPGGDTELGWMLFFHPSLIHGTPLARKMREYSFFSYRANEALHVSEQERAELASLLDLIKKEYERNLDAYSSGIILSNLELLFGYFQRYYGRQFLTRAGANRDVLARFEEVLDLDFSGEGPRTLPTVKGCAERLGYSPNYLSDLLKKETGTSAQEHIHARLIEKAKDLLLGTPDPINRVAYSLGFEYPQHFSKLFKNSTGLTPGQFRRG
jgi:AraC family transcriptional activator of pobA